LCATLLDVRKTSKVSSDFLSGTQMYPSGLYHPNFKPWGTITHRWSSSEPNFQQVPHDIMTMFVPKIPGNWFVGADWDAAESRMMALLSGQPEWLEQCEGEGLFHEISAAACFGVPLDKVTKAMRKVGKTVNFATAYGGGEGTIFEKLKPSGVRRETVRKMLKAWKAGNTHIVKFLDDGVRFANRQDYIEDAIGGWRNYYYGQVEPTKVMNFRLQAGIGSLANRAALGIASELQPGEEIVAMIHDQFVLEGPDPDRLEHLLRKHMDVTLEYEGRSVRFTIDVQRGKNLKEVK
jgi:DNA polymerase-1